MKPGIHTIIFCIFCVTTHLLAEIKLIKKDDLTLSLGLKAAMNGEIDYREVAAGFVVDAAKISLSSTYKKRLKFFLSVDPSKPNSSSKSGYSEPLDKLYLQYTGKKRGLKIRVGQFKVPFGHEQFQGMEERSLIKHRKTTREICPDLDRGIMFSKRKINDKFSFYTGVFNGTSVEQSLNAITLLVPGKFQYDKKFTNTKLTIGFNTFLRANYPYNWNLKYRWANGIYSELGIKTKKGNKVKLLGEFIEKLDFRDLSSSTKAWELGGFLITSYRNGNWEPALYAELYDKNINVEDYNDKILMGTGLNLHFLEDKLRLSMQIEYEHLPHMDDDNVIAVLSLRGFL